jgi:WD40 repeat protein/DNA-binding SARP family transcriptional activator
MTTTAQLRVFLAGPVAVEADGVVLDAGRFAGRQGRLVFVYLVAEQGRPVPRDELAEALWGEAPPATWDKALTVIASKLRAALTDAGIDGATTLAGAYGCYTLELPEGTWVDLTVATDSVEVAETALAAGELEEARAAAELAVALLRQPFLPGEAGTWVEQKRRELSELQSRALTVLRDASLRLGDTAGATKWAEQVVALEPFREAGYRRLMEAHAAAGNRAEALQVYERCRRLLAEELGAYPSPETDSIYRALLEASQTSVRPAPIAEPTVEMRNPYKGLSPFGESDARDFFGREELSRQLAERLAEDRFVAVVGPSGSGKSSLVRAGLLPLLRADGVTIAGLSPGAHPLEELEAALLRVAVNPPASLREQLEADDRGLCRALKRIVPGDETELVLFVDQLEELFTLTEDEAEQSHVLTLVGRAVRDPRSHLRLVVTLRADFYDRPLRHREFAALLQDRVLSVSPLSPDELERAIAAPAAALGVSLERGLLAEIVADVLHQPGALPLLQYALTELFDRCDGGILTRAAYSEIGGVAGALGARAGAVYTSLSEAGRAAARQLFVQLVAVGEQGTATRRPAPLADLDPAVTECVEAFGASRLLLFDSDPRGGEATVEIAHEALIVEWEPLRDWIDAARDEIRMHHRLTARAAEWDESGRDQSFLLHGTQLSQLSGLAQTAREREFVEASVAEEESRRARERALERRAVYRLRGLVAVLALAAVIAVGLTAYAFDQSHRSQQQARIATARQLASESVANVDVDPERSILLAIQAVRKATVDGAPLPEAVEALHRALAASRVVLTIRTPATAALAISPDGSRIATAGSIGSAQARDQEAASSTAATEASVWDARTGALLLSLTGATSPIHDIAFSPAGTRIATAGDNGAAIVWDARTGRRLFTLPDAEAGGGFLGVAFSPDGTRLATADGIGRVRIWSLAARRVVGTIRAGAPLCGVSWSPDGRLIGAGQCGGYNYSSASAIRVWNVRTGRLVFRTTGAPVTSMLRFSPNGLDVLAPTLNGTAEIWSLAGHRLLATLAGHSGQVDAVAYSPDGKLVATGGTDRTARIWDARTGEQLLLLAGHAAIIDAVEFTPDSRRLVTTSEDGTVRVWDVTPGGSRDWLTLSADAGGVASVIFSPDGRRLLTSGVCDGKIKLWNARTGALISTSTAPPEQQCGYKGTGTRFYAGVDATSPDGTSVAQADANGSVQILDAETGQVLRTLPGGHAGVQSIRFDPSGTRLATGNWDGTAVVWNVRSGARVQTFAAQQGIVESVRFSPDGKTLATAGEDATTQLWDIATGRRLLTLTGHSFALTDVAFSPDGRRLATSSGDGTVRVYVLPVDELLAVAEERLTRG